MNRPVTALASLLLLGVVRPAAYDAVIRNGRVLDGAGNPWVYSNVAVKDARIAAIDRVPGRGAREIDASGDYYVAPGILLQGLSASANSEPLAFEGQLRPAVVIDGGGPSMRLQDRMAHYKVPGVSLAVIEDCRIVVARAYGVITAGGPALTAASLFQAASISKPVAALGALRLAERGKLSLDADVRTRLKDWALPDSALLHGHPVTLRRLLGHGAGLTVHGFEGYAVGKPLPTIVQILEGKPPANSDAIRVEAAPGSKWSYSGGGYVVAQLLITGATGRTFPDVMRDLVFAPAGMGSSSYEQPLPASSATKAAVGHRPDGKPLPTKWHVYPEMAAAGLWTTPSDLARFAMQIVKAERGQRGALIGRATAKQMLTPQLGNWGLGLELSKPGEPRSFGHGGANEGYRTQLLMFPDRCQGAVIMTNSDAGSRLIPEILRTLADSYRWPDPMPSMTQSAIPLTPAIAARFSGSYRLKEVPDYSFRITAAADGGLLFEAADGNAERLTAQSASRLFSQDSGLQLEADGADGLKLTVPKGGNYKGERIRP